MNDKQIKKIIVNGEVRELEINEFSKIKFEVSEKMHPFGTKATTEAPIKMKVVFKDGTIQYFRGDRFAGRVEFMVKNMKDLSFRYAKEKKAESVTIYDNQMILNRFFPNNKIILAWSIYKGTIVNMLPIFLNGYVINK